MISHFDSEAYECNCYEAFLDSLILCDGLPGNENLAIQIINELRMKFNLLEL